VLNKSEIENPSLQQAGEIRNKKIIFAPLNE
jgi:hypothetical protein